MSAPDYATWPWNRCPARTESWERCDLRKGHEGDHLEQGPDLPQWSTEWTTSAPCKCGWEKPSGRFVHEATDCGGAGPALVGETREQKAWDKGYKSGHSNAMRRMSDEPNAPTTPNPYPIAAKP